VNSANSFACLFRRHANLGVAVRKLDPIAAVGHPFRLELDLAPLCELAGVAQKVQQDLPQPHGIGGERAEVLLDKIWSDNSTSSNSRRSLRASFSRQR